MPTVRAQDRLGYGLVVATRICCLKSGLTVSLPAILENFVRLQTMQCLKKKDRPVQMILFTLATI
jgi:hypothetical protein